MPEISGIGVLTAFLAGAISFLSPCVLPLVPGYVSYIAGRQSLFCWVPVRRHSDNCSSPTVTN
jgi:hypothetical protein